MSTWLKVLTVSVAMSISACATVPKNTGNICSLFKDKRSWYKSAKVAEKKWAVPIPVMMAFIRQESGFNANAAPPRTRILWLFPGPRPSTAYGYAQALKSTWTDYRRATGEWGADRDDFADAVDFVGWFNHLSIKRNQINPNDSYHLYLAYHEGHGGFSLGTYRRKTWLLETASKVQQQSLLYRHQYSGCKKELDKGWFRRMFW